VVITLAGSETDVKQAAVCPSRVLINAMEMLPYLHMFYWIVDFLI